MRSSFKKLELLVKAAHFLVEIQNRFTIFVAIVGFIKVDSRIPLERLGSAYGGWWAPIQDDTSSYKKVLVSAGLGFDTTFDQEMAERGYFVICIEPSVESFNYSVIQLGDYENVRVLNKGISTFVGEQLFYEPNREHHNSWSLVNMTDDSTLNHSYFSVTSIDQLFSDFIELENANFRFLKMDIEGGELAILESFSARLCSFDFIGVEMDFLSLIPYLKIRKRIDGIRRTRHILKNFEAAGYHLVKHENFNFFWSKI